MPSDRGEPQRAAQARALASRQRSQYQHAVQSIQQDRSLSKEDKRRRLAVLHQKHKQAMDDLRKLAHDAFRSATDHAYRRLIREPMANKSSIVMDSYRRRVEELMATEEPEKLVMAFELADLMDDPIGMHAAATVALQRRMPGVPGDPYSRLVARYAFHRYPDGQWENATAAGAWEDLTALEQWTRADHLQADATFSMPGTPEPPKDPAPPDPYDAALADVAQLYSANGTPTAPAQGGGGGEPAAP
jgi:hypothetical protein